MAQNLIVALLVGYCFIYALWTLGPKVPRRRLAVALLKRPLPPVLQKPLAAAALRQGGCGCEGCDGGAARKSQPAAATHSPLVFHPRATSKTVRPGTNR